jgi:aspartyl-tRNA(Asn)/glutamyl-tRNA(Gln) amidotransferase subunit A
VSHPAYNITSGILAGESSAKQVCEASLQAIAARNDQLAAFVHVDEEFARRQAAAIDARIAAGETVGPLAGVPIAIKDNLCTLGLPTSCASKILADYQPPYEATAIQRLRAAGAVIVGKTNMDEFAMGSSTENSAFVPARNPHDPQRVPGGSSGGSAIAVAAGMTPISLGSDTGGSIRQPAAFCGVVGLKPTYGRVSRYGLVAFGSSLDQIGPFANNVTDAGLLLRVISGHDPADATSIDREVPDYVAELDEARLDQKLSGLRIGVAKEYFGEGLDDEVRQSVAAAIELYRGLGAQIIELSLPHSQYCVAAYYIIATAEASSNLARYDGVHYGHRTEHPEGLIDLYKQSRAEGFGPEVKRRIMLGTFALSAGYYDAYYNRALKVRRLIQQDFTQAFEQVDVLLSPTTPTPAFKLGEKTTDPLSMYLADIYTIAINLAGVPAVSIPCGKTQSGLPIGMQLVAPLFDEVGLLQTARLYEQASDG